MGRTKVIQEEKCNLSPHHCYYHGVKTKSNKNIIVMTHDSRVITSLPPESINLSRRGHQIIQIIKKDRFPLTRQLLKTGVGSKKLHFSSKNFYIRYALPLFYSVASSWRRNSPQEPKFWWFPNMWKPAMLF